MKPLYRQPVLLFGIIFTALIAVQSYYLWNTAKLWKSEIYRDVHNRLDNNNLDDTEHLRATDDEIAKLIARFEQDLISKKEFDKSFVALRAPQSPEISEKIGREFKNDGYKVGIEKELNSIFSENKYKIINSKPLVIFKTENYSEPSKSLGTEQWITKFTNHNPEISEKGKEFKYIVKFSTYYNILNINTILFKKLAQQILLNILLCGFILYIFSKTLKNLRGQNQKISQLHTTIDAITHELNTPVTTLKFALKNQTSSSENALINRQIQKIEEIVAGIHHSSANSVLLSEKILDGYFEKMKTDFPQIQFNISKNFTQNKTLTEADFRLMMDNLIGNSAKYGASEISIETLFENSIKISVKDNGIGIPNNELKSIFDKYYRINNAENSIKSGLGLGLFLVKTTVEKYGGRISAQPVSPRGVLFKFEML